MSSEHPTAAQVPSGTGSGVPLSLVLCGTAPRGWEPLARALSEAMAARGQRAQIVDDSTSLAAHRDNEAARFLAFVESPARCLAQHPGADANHLLDTWSLSARDLLRSWRSRPTRWRLVDVDESERAPQALADQLLGLGIDVPALDLECANADPLGRFLADAIVTKHPTARRLYEEVHASCVPLSDDPPPTLAAADLWASHVDAQMLAAGLRSEQQLLLMQLRLAHQTLEQSARSASDTESLMREAQRDLQDCQRRLASEQAALEEMRAELLTSRQRLESEAASAKSNAALAKKAKQEAEALAAELQQERAQAQKLEHASTAMTAALQEERSAHEATRTDVERARANFEQQQTQMLTHLHYVQELLEEQMLLHERAPVEPPEEHPETTPGERVQSISAHGTSERPPHLHVNLRLQGLRLGSRSFPTLEVRLVEHAGHPGLLFWDGPGRAITAWKPNGTEGGRAFMLMIPRTPEGSSVLQRLGSLDWQLVSGVARILQRHLELDGVAKERWVACAARLLCELEALPPRLRYDQTRVTRGSEGALQVTFDGARFGERDLGTLVLQWQPTSRRLAWVAPTRTQHLALLRWPTTQEGTLAPALDLPVGAATSDGERRRWWAQTSAADRAVLLAVLDALPGAAQAADAAVLPAEFNARALTDQATAWHSQARRTLRGLRARALARRLVGGGGTPQ